MTTPSPRFASGSGSDRSGSAAAFERLDPRLQHWLWSLHWGDLRPVQEAAIHAILGQPERDVILAAPTASGKTEAAFLPLCTRLLQRRDSDDNEAGIQILYISPLKALINDQFSRLDRLCEALEIPVHRWHGDVAANRKQQVFRKPDGFLLITPESLEALFVRHGTQIRRLFGALEAIVIDELHAFFGSERGRQLQSLLHRVEVSAGRRTPRIALSATLSDLSAAARFLRPGEDARQVLLLSPPAGAQEIQAQIRGYVRRAPGRREAQTREEARAEYAIDYAEVGGPDILDEWEESERDAAAEAADTEIAEHLFSTLRGRQNLVFCNTRHEVEAMTDRLTRLSGEEHVPNEFFAHHGSLSRELRHDVEERLRDGERPITAICTSTLELGIDIGAMHTVGQIGAAPSVAGLRQRLGRSGRREGEPSRLRVYTRESEITPTTPPIDQLRLETVQAIAQLNLVVQGWCEAPDIDGGMHLSTLIQQCLSVIAERGGAGAPALWRLLCKTGPFRDIDQPTFAAFLKDLHAARLIAQMEDGTLLPGPTGERLIEHYSFYAAFATPEEYRLTAQGRALGTLPISRPLLEGSFLIFAGRRWKVLSVDEGRRVIDLAPAPGGRAPEFGGAGVWVDAHVRAEMLRIYESASVPPFLNKVSKSLLSEGRANYDRLALSDRRIVKTGGETLIFLWSSDRAAATVYLEMLRRGIGAEENGVCVTAQTGDEGAVRAVLAEIAETGFPPLENLAALVPNAEEEKHDHYLSPSLRARQYAARCLDAVAAHAAVLRAVEGS